MLKIRKAGLIDAFKIINQKRKFEQLCTPPAREEQLLNTQDYYFAYEGNLYIQLIFGNVWLLYEGNHHQGIVVFDRVRGRLYHMAFGNPVPFEQLMKLISSTIPCHGATMSVQYGNLDILSAVNVYHFDMLDNLMYMQWESHKIDKDQLDNNVLLFRRLVIGKEEKLRIELQNEIFSNIRNRTPLALNDILYEQATSRFLKDYCFILEEYREPIGYGQVLKMDQRYFLVNFGIVEECRRHGYGAYFLQQIMKICHLDGIDKLYLSVDRNNDAAINLYKRMGFQPLYNNLTIELK